LEVQDFASNLPKSNQISPQFCPARGFAASPEFPAPTALTKAATYVMQHAKMAFSLHLAFEITKFNLQFNLQGGTTLEERAKEKFNRLSDNYNLVYKNSEAQLVVVDNEKERQKRLIT